MPEKKCALYVRTSTVKGTMTGEESLDAQLALLRKWVDYANESNPEAAWKICGEYRENEVSAKNLERPAFERLVADIEDGRIDVVMVTKLDRICRSLHDFYSLIEFLGRHGVEFIGLKERFDTTTAIGKFPVDLQITMKEVMGGSHA